MNVTQAGSLRDDSITTCTRLALSFLGTIFPTGSSNEIIDIWTIGANKLVCMQPGVFSSRTYQVKALSPHGMFLAVASASDLDVRIIELHSGRLYAILKHTGSNAGFVLFDSDSTHVIVWTVDHFEH